MTIKEELGFTLLFSLLYIGYLFTLFSYLNIEVLTNIILINIGGFIVILIILLLATFRLTRMIVNDSISSPIRDILEHSNYSIFNYIRKIIGCPWCTSLWVAPLVIFSTLSFYAPLIFIVLILTISAGSILVGKIGQK